METERFNYGIALLKVWMCFEVVMCHFDVRVISVKSYDILRISKEFAVPCFMIISFYYFAKSDFNDLSNIKYRMLRLIIPHISWSIVYFGAHICTSNDGIINALLKLVLQIGFGHTLNAAMWFQVDLIAITALYIWGKRKWNINLKKLSIIGLVIAYAMQYTGINYEIFSKLPYSMSYTLGRIAEMFPFAAAGYLLGSKNLLMDIKIKIKREKLYLYEILGIIVGGYVLRSCLLRGKGFGYNGGLDILITACLINILFYCISDVMPKILLPFVKKFASYTMGIYFSHNLIGRILLKFFPQGNGIIFSLMVFGGALIFCWVISKIPNKQIKSLLI